jgi:hypothetical protein
MGSCWGLDNVGLQHHTSLNHFPSMHHKLLQFIKLSASKSNEGGWLKQGPCAKHYLMCGWNISHVQKLS